MLVVVRKGLPIGLYVTNAYPHELRLAEKYSLLYEFQENKADQKIASRIGPTIVKNSIDFSESKESNLNNS
jgi:hypothetical protein